ncbi:serine/arginine repetitive matrix protein 1-like [Amphibalanus amphitrite]|uniref:serine/arginine repetitive matrix protein 1-like n=1 Tax=Amphibalanus amphitrite TaxID=1232801 RepID=UPI001C916436|nr:serine/arginine repetitive matrix protein 1-like [Amphibalanus amphitrite]
MSQPLLDVDPVCFRACFPGGQCLIITTVLDHVMYGNLSQRQQILETLNRDGLTAAVEEEIRAVCRQLLASPEYPSTVHQRLTTILVSPDDRHPVLTPTGSDQPPACTLVVAVNPEGALDQVWDGVVSRLHQFEVFTDRRRSRMVPPRRSRRLSIMPEPAAAEPAAAATSRPRAAGRGSRSSRVTSPARRPAEPRAAPQPSAKRGRGAGGSGSSTSSSRLPTRTAAVGGAAPARKKAASPASSVRTTSTTSSRRSTAVRSSRRSVAVSPPVLVATRRQTRRSKPAASPPVLSPAKQQVARATRGARSPSFARDIRVRTLEGASGEMTDFSMPEDMTGHKSQFLEELMMDATVMLETPGLLKRFSKKLKEPTPKPKSPAKPAPRPKSPAKPAQKSKSPAKSPPRSAQSTVTQRGRQSGVAKRTRSESRSPSATPPKKPRAAVADRGSAKVSAPATVGRSPPRSVTRGRPSMSSVRKSLSASLADVPMAASSPASPVLRVHTPAAARASAKRSQTVTEVSQTVTEALQTVTQSAAVTAGQTPKPSVDSPDRPTRSKALLEARSSIRRRPAGQPPPEDQVTASPNLKPARDAAAAALSRAYVALARSEAKQKDLFRSRVSGVAAVASPALAQLSAEHTSKKIDTDETSAVNAGTKTTAERQLADSVVSEQPPAKPVPDAPTADPAPSRSDASEPVFASPAGRGTPRGQLAPRSSVRRAPASALRRVLDRAPDSAARSDVRRVLRRPSPPPLDRAAGGDSPLVEAPLTRSRRAKLTAELSPPVDGIAAANNVEVDGAKPPPPAAVTALSDEKDGYDEPRRRSRLRTTCLMLLLLVVVVVAVLWLGRAQLPAEQRNQLEQLQRTVQAQSQQLEQLVRRQLEAARGWLDRVPALAAGGQ